MFNLELTQRWLLNEELRKIVPDPESVKSLKPEQLWSVMEAIVEDSGASLALRKHVAARYPMVARRGLPKPPPSEVVPQTTRASETEPPVVDPPFRRLRAYAADPSFSARLATASINEVVLKVRWEPLAKGPAGDYLLVDDTDAAGKKYKPVNLDDARLLAQDGLAPSEGNPAFHQQMVYAVAMKTIEHFEHALGRPVLWRQRPNPKNPYDDSQATPRLVIRPHALRQANAYYSPQEVALLFGYFDASDASPVHQVPGSRVYTCLSHDIIAHETTHAILDSMHRRFNEATNLDVLALHEGFADIVALLQHFTIPELLESEIGRTRGDLETQSTLGSLAIQFGYAAGGRGALREAIGGLDEKGVWTRLKPDPTALQKRVTPHARGAILVAAVFDAFLAVYKASTEDLLRIYTGGTGVLPSGAIHPDLVRRLAAEAVGCASHVLSMCIRALDYIPPVDITFGEYLRGLITADFELGEGGRYSYRVAFVEAFRARGIYPPDLDTPSVDTLRWQGYDFSQLPKKDRAAIVTQYQSIIIELRAFADRCLYIKDRNELFFETRKERRVLHEMLTRAFKATPKFAAALGIDPTLPRFELHELRTFFLTGPDRRQIPHVVVELAQSRIMEVDGRRFRLRGGSTLVVDLSKMEIKYQIIKNIMSKARIERNIEFWRGIIGDPLLTFMFAFDHPEPFALLHTLADEGL